MNKNSVSLRLTEPVIFLRSGSDSASRRRRRGRAEYPPALLRGLLTLKLAKPTKIKSIEVEFEGLTRTDWPDVAGPITTRRMDLSEEKAFLSSKLVFFQADQQRRSRTVGPGLHLDSPQEIGQLGCIEEEARGRRGRRESPEITRHRQPFSAISGPSVDPPPFSEIYGSDRQRPALESKVSAPAAYSSESSTTGVNWPNASSSTPPQPHANPSSISPSETNLNGTVERKTSRRRSARISLSSMLQDMKDMVNGHQHKVNYAHEHESAIAENEDDGEPSQLLKRGRSQGRKEKGTIARIGEALGIDGDDDGADGDSSWREFKPGEYNYPIAFTLSTDLPPSIEAEYGSVKYELRATVRRPGAFTPKLTASADVELVVSPAEDDAEEGDAVVIERQWDLELRYMISIGGRNFPQGSEIPWHIQLMPLNKMKLHRLTFLLEEKIDYHVPQHKLTRSEAVRRYQLLAARHPQSLSNNKAVARAAPPLLPIFSEEASSDPVILEFSDPPTFDFDGADEANTASRSQDAVGTQDDGSESYETGERAERRSERLAHIMSPDGPWHLAGTLKVPQAFLHMSHKHSWSFVSVKHALKLYMRVERGDEPEDPKTGRKKQFDIIIETPVNILSHYCRPDWATLPRYETVEVPPSTDAEGNVQISHLTPNSSQSEITGPLSPVVHPAHLSRPPSPPHHSSNGLIGAALALPHVVGHALLMDSLSSSTAASHPVTPGTPPDDPTRDVRAQTSHRFASLMAGFEDEEGELPPTYQDAATAGVSGAPQSNQNAQVIQVAVPTPSGFGRRPKTSAGVSRGPGSGSISREHSESRSRSVVRQPTMNTGIGANTGSPRPGSGGRSVSANRARSLDRRVPISLFPHP